MIVWINRASGGQGKPPIQDAADLPLAGQTLHSKQPRTQGSPRQPGGNQPSKPKQHNNKQGMYTGPTETLHATGGTQARTTNTEAH